jgi:TonB family protein
MNRLQKKCLIAAAGTHLLLVVVVLCSGFVTSKPKPDETQLLTVIPDKLIEEEFSSGVKNAQLPPPTPPVVTPTPPVPTPPTPEPPKPVEPVKPVESVKPVEPVKPPEPEPVKPLSHEELIPVNPKPKPKPHEVSLVPVKHVVPKVSEDTEAQNEAREAAKAAKAAKQRAANIAKIAQAIKENSSSSTEIVMPGNSTASDARYAAAVKSKYEAAWTPPDDTSSDDANVKVSVTIGRDGTVTSARILDRSGDSKVDNSVQRTLDRVTFVAPFPDDWKENERTFIINFNLKAKRMLG